jgi:putative glutamine amidotransferase
VILPVTGQAREVSEIIDGLLLTGGRDIPPEYYGEGPALPADMLRLENRERIEFEMALLVEILLKAKPVLAICFGMQLLNVVHGGTLMQDIGSADSRYLDHTAGTHGIVISDTLNACLQQRYVVNSSHHQSVNKVGNGLAVFAASDDGIIEAIYKRDYNHCVGVQWHPERIRMDPLSAWLFKSLSIKADYVRRLR